jgi:hypothetical protein
MHRIGAVPILPPLSLCCLYYRIIYSSLSFITTSCSVVTLRCSRKVMNPIAIERYFPSAIRCVICALASSTKVKTIFWSSMDGTSLSRGQKYPPFLSGCFAITHIGIKDSLVEYHPPLCVNWNCSGLH